MSEKAQHTPTPWHAEGPDMFGDFNILHKGDALAIGAVVTNMRLPEEVAANAQFIVTAVNSHAALVEAAANASEAMRVAVRQLARFATEDEAVIDFTELMQAQLSLSSALSLAKGETQGAE